VLSYIMGAETKREWIESMEETGVPVYDSAYAAVDTLEAMYRWRRYADGVENYDPSVEDASRTI
jgi:acyl-CoA synthetase (NDP forming)